MLTCYHVKLIRFHCLEMSAIKTDFPCPKSLNQNVYTEESWNPLKMQIKLSPLQLAPTWTGMCPFTDHNAQLSPRHPGGNAEDWAMPSPSLQCRGLGSNAEPGLAMPCRGLLCRSGDCRQRTDLPPTSKPVPCAATAHVCEADTPCLSYIGEVSGNWNKIRSQNATRVTKVDTDDIITHCAEW